MLITEVGGVRRGGREKEGSYLCLTHSRWLWSVTRELSSRKSKYVLVFTACVDEDKFAILDKMVVGSVVDN